MKEKLFKKPFELEEEKDPEYLIKSLIDYGTVTILAADGGTGKTTFGLQMLNAIVNGDDFFGYKATKEKCLWINNEMRENHLKRKIRECANTANQELFYTLNYDFNLCDIDDIRDVAKSASDLGIRVVFIDCLAQVTVGADENDNNAFSLIFQNVRKIFCNEYNLTVIIIHHTSKNLFNTGVKELDQSRVRGATAITTNAELVIMMATMKNGTIKVKTAKTRWNDTLELDLVFNGPKLVLASDNRVREKTPEVEIRNQIIHLLKTQSQQFVEGGCHKFSGLKQLYITDGINKARSKVIEVLNEWCSDNEKYCSAVGGDWLWYCVKIGNAKVYCLYDENINVEELPNKRKLKSECGCVDCIPVPKDKMAKTKNRPIVVLEDDEDVLL